MKTGVSARAAASRSIEGLPPELTPAVAAKVGDLLVAFGLSASDPSTAEPVPQTEQSGAAADRPPESGSE